MEQIFRKKSGTAEMSATFREEFNLKIAQLNGQKDCSASHLPTQKYRSIIDRLNEMKNGPTMKKAARDYRLLKQYEVVTMRSDNTNFTEMLQKPGTDLLYVPQEHLFDVICPIHLISGHGGRDVMYGRARMNYANITKETLQLFTDLCEECKVKKTSGRRVNLNEKSSISNIIRRRCRVDVVDMGSEVEEGEYKFIMMYQDHRTKYRFLKALKTKEASEVANHLVDVFCAIGSPPIMDSNNSPHFACDVITEVKKIWPQCIMVYGANPSATCSNLSDVWEAEVKCQVKRWMHDNNSIKWWQGLRFIQWQMNNSKRGTNRKSSYAALFHEDAKLGLQHANIPNHLTVDLQTENDLTDTLKSLTQDQEVKLEEEIRGPGQTVTTQIKMEKLPLQPKCNLSSDVDGIFQGGPRLISSPTEHDTFDVEPNKLPGQNEMALVGSLHCDTICPCPELAFTCKCLQCCPCNDNGGRRSEGCAICGSEVRACNHFKQENPASINENKPRELKEEYDFQINFDFNVEDDICNILEDILVS